MLRRFLSILDRDSELVLSLARKFQFVQYCNKVMQTLIFSTNFVAFQQKLKNIEWSSISLLGTV